MNNVMNNDLIYTELLKLIKKYKKYGIQNILVECYAGNVIEPSKKILANLYIVLDRYVSNIDQNKVYKKETKEWVLNKYVNSLPEFISDSKKYIEDKLYQIGIRKVIDYSYTKKQLEEYLIYVNAELSLNKEERKTTIVINTNNDNNNKPFNKPKWSEMQNVGKFNEKTFVNYSHLLTNFPVNTSQKNIINKIWELFLYNEKILHKEIFYLYIMYLVVPEIKFTDVLKFIESPMFISKKLVVINNKNFSINMYIVNKITDFINKNKDLPKEFIEKHKYSTHLKFKFKNLFIKKYLGISKNKNINDLVMSLNQTLRNNIKNITNIPYDIENYIENINGYFTITDNYYLIIQKNIENYINSEKLNNKSILLNNIYKVIPKTIKNNIINEIDTYYFD